MPNSKIGFSKAMSAGWLRIEKNAETGPCVFRNVCGISKNISLFSAPPSPPPLPPSPPPPPLQVESITDTVQQLLSTVEGESSISQGNLKELKKRQLVINV